MSKNALWKEAAALLLQHERDMEVELEATIPRSGNGMRVHGGYPVCIITADVEEESIVPAGSICIPASVASLSYTPFFAGVPLELGVVYTFTPFNVGGTPPITYEWFINLSLVFTGETLVFALYDADVVNRDASGLGVMFIYVAVANACGEGHTSYSGQYPAQGTAPP